MLIVGLHTIAQLNVKEMIGKIISTFALYLTENSYTVKFPFECTKIITERTQDLMIVRRDERQRKNIQIALSRFLSDHEQEIQAKIAEQRLLLLLQLVFIL